MGCARSQYDLESEARGVAVNKARVPNVQCGMVSHANEYWSCLLKMLLRLPIRHKLFVTIRVIQAHTIFQKIFAERLIEFIEL